MNATAPPLPESLTIRPPAAEWRGLVRQNTSAEGTLIRRELGLATDRPVIMTGHHAEFWHTGILSKYLTADAAAVALKAQPAWLVVDQDRADLVAIRYPRRTDGKLSIGIATVRERNDHLSHFPPTTSGPAEPAIQLRVDSILGTLERHSGPMSRRVAAALDDLLRPMMTLSAPTLFATDLHRTTLFQSLVGLMRREPERCIAAYNAAAARHPSAAVRPLIGDDMQDRWELPLWHLPPGRPRTHVYAEMDVPVAELAPKALFMTGLMRLAACDLFIHGFGGGGAEGDAREGYDLITDEWLQRWLGVPRVAPMALVTATRYLPLGAVPPPSPAEAAEAAAKAHRARHSPGLLGDQAGEARKQSLVHATHAAPRDSHQRTDFYHQMHRLLESVRGAHGPALEELSKMAAELKNRLGERDLIYDRTWPFALFPPESLQDLRDQVHARFAGLIR